MFLSRPRPSLVTIQPDKVDRSLFEGLELVSVLFFDDLTRAPFVFDRI
jgi:hypothetical protein